MMIGLRLIAPSFAVCLMILSVNRAVGADNERGAELAAMCASCHRLDGSGKAIPSIVGMDKQKLIDAIAAYQSGARASSIMHAVALQLGDGETATLADYLAARPKEGTPR